MWIRIANRLISYYRKFRGSSFWRVEKPVLQMRILCLVNLRDDFLQWRVRDRDIHHAASIGEMSQYLFDGCRSRVETQLYSILSHLDRFCPVHLKCLCHFCGVTHFNEFRCQKLAFEVRDFIFVDDLSVVDDDDAL